MLATKLCSYGVCHFYFFKSTFHHYYYFNIKSGPLEVGSRVPARSIFLGSSQKSAGEKYYFELHHYVANLNKNNNTKETR
jgi:hypothetical protein